MKRKLLLLLTTLLAVGMLAACTGQDDQKTDPVTTDSELYTATVNYLEQEFDRVFSPYYDLQELIPSDWVEADDGKSATFFYKMTYLYYNRDPDQVAYIRENKDSNPETYQKLYDEYLALQEGNFEFKSVLKDDGTIELYSNKSPVGEPEWGPVAIDDYIISNHND